MIPRFFKPRFRLSRGVFSQQIIILHMDTKVQEIPIDERLKRLIPPLSKEEFQQLENNCLEDGIRDPLVVAYYPDPDTGEEVEVLADGHNRYEIARKHNIPFTIVQKEFESFEDVQIWMIDNQKGRRNLSDYIKFEMAQVKADLLRVKGLEKRKETLAQNTSVLSIFDKTEAHDTRKEIASDLGWSTGKVAMADVVKKHIEETGNDELAEQLRTNELSINKAYQAVRKEKKKQEVEAKIQESRADLEQYVSKEIDIHNTDLKFNIIYADPPWRYWEGGEKNQSLHYPTMSIEEICNLPVSDIADENSILFLWVTFPILEQAFEVIKLWGFEFSTCGFVWVKRNKKSDSWFFGNGSWTRANAEFCLIARRGQITRLDASISQIIDDPIMEHSRKPYRVRSLITRLVGELPRIELFSRCSEDDGWFNWGNKI